MEAGTGDGPTLGSWEPLTVNWTPLGVFVFTSSFVPMREDKVSHRNPLIVLRKCTPETGKSYGYVCQWARCTSIGNDGVDRGEGCYLAERVICSFSDVAKVRRRGDSWLCIGLCLLGLFGGGGECVCERLVGHRALSFVLMDWLRGWMADAMNRLREKVCGCW